MLSLITLDSPPHEAGRPFVVTAPENALLRSQVLTVVATAEASTRPGAEQAAAKAHPHRPWT